MSTDQGKGARADSPTRPLAEAPNHAPFAQLARGRSPATVLRNLALAAALSVIGWISAAIVVAQTVDTGPFFRAGGRQVVRFWQDFVLRQGEAAHQVLVVSGSTTIAGSVHDDVVAILGEARLEPTAHVRGSVIVIGGNVTIAEGAVIERDLMVYGGSSDLPVTFYPGGQHISIGNAWMGAQLRAVVPWVTYGLLWGRLIVVSISWVWWFVAISLILTVATNVLLHGAVGQSADTLASRPASTFITGLLMLLLTGPVAVLLAATLIGVAIVPFLICAVIVAWLTGKVAVSRWIGRTILGYGPDETRLQGLAAVIVGFAAICVLYAVPLVGIATWALVGVFGLGAASLTVLAAIRRERGRARSEAAGRPDRSDAGGLAPEPSAPMAPDGPPVMPLDAPLRSAEVLYQSHVPAPASEPPPPPPGASGLAAMARATFVDRLAAGVLDVLFVLFMFNVFLEPWVRRGEQAVFFFLFAYFVAFWAWKGTTLGGMVCNLRVIRANGAPLAGADAVVRGLASLFSFVPLGLGFFWILRDPHQQAWHDKIAGTVVVKVPRDYPV